jgi:hypothetical protein
MSRAKTDDNHSFVQKRSTYRSARGNLAAPETGNTHEQSATLLHLTLTLVGTV